MNAMGIIGIILSGTMAVFLLMGGVYALLEKYFEEKRRTIADVIDYAAEAYSEVSRKLFQNIMEDAMENIPNMTKACMKSFGEDEEP